MFKNWRCNTYFISGDETKKEYDYSNLKDYFDIHGQNHVLCIKDCTFGCRRFKEGRYYLIAECRTGFLLGDQVTTFNYIMFENLETMDGEIFLVEATNHAEIKTLQIQGCANMGMLATPYAYLHGAKVKY